MFAALTLLFASVFAGRRFSREEILTRLGTDEKAANRLPRRTYSAELKATVPASFDARQQWPQCYPAVRDQAQCGSCWAHGATESLSWRQCIGGVVNSAISLAPQWLVNCDHGNMGCNGGQLPNAWSFMSIFGVVEESCKPYKAVNQTCTDVCDDGSVPKKYYAAGGQTFSSADLESIMYDIMTNGPVETAFSVYEDFEEYTGGIYKHTYGEYLGGHAVMIVGWGEENGTKYWIVQNSWGTSWGEGGFFRIVRGTNDCGFEGQITAGPVGTKPYEPPVPKIPSNYYTVFNLKELGMEQGTAFWAKEGGNYFREEAYMPGTKVVEVGQAGVRGKLVEYVVQGDMKNCMCMNQNVSALNILEVPPGAVYSRSYWSGDGSSKDISEYILTDYVYEVGALEKLTYTFVDAAVPSAATPYLIDQVVFGVQSLVDIIIYDGNPDMSNSLFDDPCVCDN